MFRSLNFRLLIFGQSDQEQKKSADVFIFCIKSSHFARQDG